jgi:RNA polymerase sigma-70 factor, ECF subfamily
LSKVTPTLRITNEPLEPRGFDALFDAWMPSVLGWCRRLGGPKINAEDAAQDVFIVVLRRAHTVQDMAAFRAWVFGVTRKTLAQHRRRAWVRHWLPGATMLDRAATSAGPMEMTEQERVRARVHEAVLALPDKYREVIVLCDLEERPVWEVAQLLDLPPDTIKTQRRRGRERLCEALHDLSQKANP